MNIYELRLCNKYVNSIMGESFFKRIMGQHRAKTKEEKCKYKRCLAKKFYPVENPRYCGKHVDKLEYKEAIATSSVDNSYPWNTNPSEIIKSKTTIVTKIKNFIFVHK